MGSLSSKSQIIEDENFATDEQKAKARKINFRIISMDSLKRAFEHISDEAKREGDYVIITHDLRIFWFGHNMMAEMDIGWKKGEIAEEVQEMVADYMAKSAQNKKEFMEERAS